MADEEMEGRMRRWRWRGSGRCGNGGGVADEEMEGEWQMRRWRRSSGG